jgi:hypothetical protein
VVIAGRRADVGEELTAGLGNAAHLGTTLMCSGERESGTARPEEAVAAFDAWLMVAEAAWPIERVRQCAHISTRHEQ